MLPRASIEARRNRVASQRSAVRTNEQLNDSRELTYPSICIHCSSVRTLSLRLSHPHTSPKMAAAGSKFRAFMNHPAGPRTVFFWAPMMKWCLVAAGLKDLNRPAEKLSVPQQVALAGTGMIWVRYSLVITPVNYSLAAVNFFVGATGLAQLYRIWE